MCGLAGYVLAASRETSSARLRSALLAMRHRGPDDEGLTLIDPRDAARQDLVTPASAPGVRGCDRVGTVAEMPHAVAFGHRRFSIVDTSPDAHQPFWSGDGTVCAALNGEVYNYVELREELRGLGRAFRTTSDTEVLVAAYQQWGTTCFDHMNGFWAVSLWDARRRQVLLGRDRIGKAPLYLWQDASGLYWASELKGLFALRPRAAEKVDLRSVAEFVKFNRRDIGETTCYEGVTSLPRASYAWVAPDVTPRPSRYWSVPGDRLRPSEIGVREAAERVESLLRDAVRIRLRADVPVGVQLSGGLDSSTTLALAAQQSARVTACTVKFDEKEADEEPFARMAAGRYADRVDYHVIRPAPDDLLDRLDSYVHLMGEPFHSPNQFTSQGVWRDMHDRGLRVVLYGAGGDEVFAGYADEYYLPYLRYLFSKGALGSWVASSLRSSEGMLGRQVADYAQRVRARLGPASRPPAAGDPFVPPPGITLREGPAEEIRGLLLDNMTDWRTSYWVRIDNQNSMGVPVELRCPFLDHRVVEHAFRLPVEYLIRGGWMKWILRRAMEPHLPPAVVWRKRKMGFPFPLRTWLGRSRSRLQEALSRMDCPMVDRKRLWDRYDAMSAENPRRLWCILAVALWWTRCVQGEPLQTEGRAAAANLTPAAQLG